MHLDISTQEVNSLVVNRVLDKVIMQQGAEIMASITKNVITAATILLNELVVETVSEMLVQAKHHDKYLSQSEQDKEKAWIRESLRRDLPPLSLLPDPEDESVPVLRPEPNPTPQPVIQL